MSLHPKPRLCLWGHHRHDLVFTTIATGPKIVTYRLDAKALARVLINWLP